MFNKTAQQAGFSLIEVIFVSALSLVIFGALFASFKYSLEVINLSRTKLSALSVANDRMEFFRSLPYDDVGTVSGIPAGLIPQNSTVVLNGVDFQERVLVEYVDDEADGKDGTGTPDSNGIPSDYKRVKAEYTWSINGQTNVIYLISNIVPRSIESTAGGGTVRINVLDADVTMLAGADVQLINTTTGSPIDVTRVTDVSGIALFSGAPAASDYEVVVTANISGNDYSTAQTHQATVALPNPSVSPFSVLESDVSTLTFQIGELSDITINTLSALVTGSVVEKFTDLLGIADRTNAEVDSGALILTNTLGVYDATGNVYLNNVTPVTLSAWGVARVAVDLPISTTHKVQFFTGVAPGPYTLIPDGDLNGNTTGFTDTLIDLSELDAGVYSSLVVGITLNTTDSNVTPAVEEVGVYYRESSVSLVGEDLDIVGTKVIGTDALSAPIYKYINQVTTDGTGEVELSDMEFDTYNITPVGAYDVAVACPAHPLVHEAGVDSELELLVVPNNANTLRVSVVDTGGMIIPGADINLVRSGYDVTLETNTCGQAFFTGGVTDNADYVLTVSATGYNTEVVNPLTISEDTVSEVVLTE